MKCNHKRLLLVNVAAIPCGIDQAKILARDYKCEDCGYMFVIEAKKNEIVKISN